MQTRNPASITPRQVANKSNKGVLKQAIHMALDIESVAVKRNTQTFNRNHYLAVAEIEDYESLKNQARKLKEQAIEELPQLLIQLEQSVKDNGGNYYLAQDAEDACNYILKVCQNHDASLVVKGKSMTTEEIKLNHTLEKNGIEVAETDLAEFILQLADEQPSHITAPAIHRSRERISELFIEKFNPDCSLETGEELTKFAREKLREKFLTADVGISGANFIAADSGTIVLVESEANIRLTTLVPDVHIAIAGVEKVLPTRADLAPFIELLAPSATGQPLSSYTSIIRPPLDIPVFSFDNQKTGKREFHLVLIDNGRMAMRDDPLLFEALYCIRCSACLNSCANFQAVGGHAFGGETYSGGIGGAWEAGTGELQNARFSELCTGCSRCVPQCPVQIDIPWLNEGLQERLNQESSGRKTMLQKIFLGNFHLTAKWGARFVHIANWLGAWSFSRNLMEKWLGIDRRRVLPKLSSNSLTKQYRKMQSALSSVNKKIISNQKAVLFADVYTNYNDPARGMATVNVLRTIGVDIVLSNVLPAGRAALSQGMVATAAERAKKTANYLEKFIDDGREVIVIEPSVLALFRRDYSHLLDNQNLFRKLAENCYDPVEYLQKTLQESDLEINTIFNPGRLSKKAKIFYHIHCQQKTINTATPTIEFLKKIGFEVVLSDVECCGMAGSFGYKQEFYDVSMRVGEDLFDQILSAEETEKQFYILASGISCKDQIMAGLRKSALHPMELLEKIL